MFQGTYVHYKEIKAAQGIKITAQVIGPTPQLSQLNLLLFGSYLNIVSRFWFVLKKGP